MWRFVTTVLEEMTSNLSPAQQYLGTFFPHPSHHVCASFLPSPLSFSASYSISRFVMLQRQAEANGHDAGACEPSLSGVEIKLSWQVGSTASQCPLKTVLGRGRKAEARHVPPEVAPFYTSPLASSWHAAAGSCLGAASSNNAIFMSRKKKRKEEKKPHTKAMGTTNSPWGDTPPDSVLCWFDFFFLFSFCHISKFLLQERCVSAVCQPLSCYIFSLEI